MLKVVADNKIPYLKGVLEKYAEVIYLPGAEITSEILKDADGLITRTRTKCNAESLAGSQVAIIASATIGFDHIDTTWCEANGIEWTNAPGCNSESVKQYVAAVLALLIQEKKWLLRDKSIAVVGVGNVGSKVSAMARAFGMNVYEVDPPRARKEKDNRFFNLEDISSKVDIVTFHTPLTHEGVDKTYHLCDDNLLSKLKRDAIIINSSRGEVVHCDALKRALQDKAVGGVVLDVWENEPLIDSDLLDLVWIATPHIAGYSQDGKAKGTQMSVQAISKKFNLGLDAWQASDIPEPDKSEIVINCDGLGEEEVISKAIYHTYAIKKDDADLRMDIDRFEYLRGSYPVRREFQAYSIQLEKGSEAVQNILLKLGFQNVTIV